MTMRRAGHPLAAHGVRTFASKTGGSGLSFLPGVKHGFLPSALGVGLAGQHLSGVVITRHVMSSGRGDPHQGEQTQKRHRALEPETGGKGLHRMQ